MAVKQLGIVGAGLMGSGVAEVAAKAGIEVIVRSRSRDAADASYAGLQKSLSRQVERGKLEAVDRRRSRRTRARRSPTSTSSPSCDLVLEAVVEDLPTKQELFAELDRICAPATILASNTSTLPIIELAMATSRPERVCGLHFFNPAPVMSLVEIARALTTSDETMSEVRRLRRGVRQDRRRRQGPGRLRRERAPVPLPQQRGEALRRRRRQSATTSTPR